jgi:hypothetical protein
LVPILFAALLFVGCGGGGSGGESGYTVSFYGENLEFKGTQVGGTVNLGAKAAEYGVYRWYKAGETNATYGYFTATADISFYAAPDVKEVTNELGFLTLANSPTFSSGKYLLKEDIELTALSHLYGWTPANFTGIFDGNGHTISGLWVNSDLPNAGLFGKVNNGIIRNLSIELDDRGINGGEYVGAVAGTITGNSVIDNVTVTGSVSGEGMYVGGIAGYVGSSTIVDSSSTGKVSGTNVVGGIVGRVYGGNITNSYSKGDVTGEKDAYGESGVGGIAGWASGGSIIFGSHSEGNISGNGGLVGGIVGWVNGASVNGSYSTGNIDGDYEVGGIAGHLNSFGNIYNSYSTGNVHGDNHSVGGIAGVVDKSSVVGSYSTGNVSGVHEKVGGIAGDLHTIGAIVSDSYSTGNVNGEKYVGGIVGEVYDSGTTITRNYAIGNVNGTTYVGGIVGRATDSSITYNAAINPLVVGTNFVNRVIGSGGGTAGNIATNTLTGTFTDDGVLSHEGTLTDADKFKLKATYDESGLGWDFDDIWNIDDGNGYPYLKWQNY